MDEFNLDVKIRKGPALNLLMASDRVDSSNSDPMKLPSSYHNQTYISIIHIDLILNFNQFVSIGSFTQIC